MCIRDRGLTVQAYIQTGTVYVYVYIFCACVYLRGIIYPPLTISHAPPAASIRYSGETVFIFFGNLTFLVFSILSIIQLISNRHLILSIIFWTMWYTVYLYIIYILNITEDFLYFMSIFMTMFINPVFYEFFFSFTKNFIYILLLLCCC